MLYNDDCLNILKNMQESYIDMIYLDPPFFTQKNQRLTDKNGKEYTFNDIWATRNEYLDYITVRLVQMHRVLKDSGTIFLQCDNSASHYIRICLDKVFGENNFRSEIIWTYKRWSNSQKGLIPAHQTIFFYSKSNNYIFNTHYSNYSLTTNIDQILQERAKNCSGKTIYKRDASGKTVMLSEKKGVPLSDVWDIPFLNPKAKERTGYPTQKPIELLERIIQISTHEGDLVLDPFCGSGTTLISSVLLNRNYIGIDLNPDAIAISKQRLNLPFKTTSNLLKRGINSYINKTERELAILKQIDCIVVQRNKGIDAFLSKYYNGLPVSVKIQKQTETFLEAIKLLYDASIKKNCSFSILITNETDYQRYNNSIPTNMIILNDYNSQIQSNLYNTSKLQQLI